MQNMFDHNSHQIILEVVQSQTGRLAGLWSASYCFTGTDGVVSPPVQACTGQLSAHAAQEKALRFAKYAVDARDEPRRSPIKEPTVLARLAAQQTSPCSVINNLLASAGAK